MSREHGGKINNSMMQKRAYREKCGAKNKKKGVRRLPGSASFLFFYPTVKKKKTTQRFKFTTHQQWQRSHKRGRRSSGAAPKGREQRRQCPRWINTGLHHPGPRKPQSLMKTMYTKKKKKQLRLARGLLRGGINVTIWRWSNHIWQT